MIGRRRQYSNCRQDGRGRLTDGCANAAKVMPGSAVIVVSRVGSCRTTASGLLRECYRRRALKILRVNVGKRDNQLDSERK
jgi:hypothetical protein